MDSGMGPLGVARDAAKVDRGTVVVDAAAAGVAAEAGVPIDAEGGGKAVPDDDRGADAELAPIVAPHSPQKRSAASAGAEQDGHTTASDAPHWTQKRRPSLFSCWQAEQRRSDSFRTLALETNRAR
jgi:hypothetical protein